MKKNHIKRHDLKRLLPAASAVLLAALLASCARGGGEQTFGTDISSSAIPDAPQSVTEGAAGTQDRPGPESTAVATEPDILSVAVPEGAVEAAQAIIYDASARRVLYSHNRVIDGRVYPASTTKLFTAYLALQYLSPGEVVTAGDELSLLASDASIAYIKRGHRLTAEMLVEAMLLPSGGDAAYVIAAAAGKKISGSDTTSGVAAVKLFIAEMNRRLAAMGFEGTHFSNPDGYHDPDHYSTLEDMAGIGALALENETIMKYAALPSDRVVYASGETNSWKNTNELILPDSLYYCADAIGLKTGSTDEAGYCVMTAARDPDGRYYVIGVFGGSTYFSRFSDAATLIGYALGKR